MRHAGISETFGDRPIDRYDGEIAFTDRHLGQVLRAARALARPTYIVVTADHGEEFRDHGGNEHGHTLYQELVRAPLLVAGPGIAPARIAQRIPLVDVMPSVLELLGVRADAQPSMAGESFVPLLHGQSATPRPIVAELRLKKPTATDSLVLGRYKLIVPVATGRAELYDLERDPREQRDLAGRQATRVAELRAQLDSLLSRARDGAPESDSVELQPDEARTLRELGYLGDD